MIKVIIYDEACEVLNIEEYLRDDIEIVGYLKNSIEYFGEYINDIKVYTISDIKEKLKSIEFDYVIVNSRYSSVFYEKIKECGISPENILDVLFFSYDSIKNSFKEKLLCCKEGDFLNFNTLFLGRNYIKDELISKYFGDYVNISNKFLDVHYNYHLLYYLIKNNKINENVNVGIFMNYSMLYENIDLLEDKYCFIKIFEEIFSVHKNLNLNSTYFDVCYENFKDNSSKVFKEINLSDLNSIDNFKISNNSIEKIRYDTQVETINYKDSNVVAFKMNKNIMAQKLKILHENNINVFFIIPPVYKEYRTYINNTLRKEFYMVLNKNLNQNLFVFDYFNLDLDDKYFSSPTNLNLDGCKEFLKLLSYDVKSKVSCVKICNDL